MIFCSFNHLCHLYNSITILKNKNKNNFRGVHTCFVVRFQSSAFEFVKLQSLLMEMFPKMLPLHHPDWSDFTRSILSQSVMTWEIMKQVFLRRALYSNSLQTPSTPEVNAVKLTGKVDICYHRCVCVR